MSADSDSQKVFYDRRSDGTVVMTYPSTSTTYESKDPITNSLLLSLLEEVKKTNQLLKDISSDCDSIACEAWKQTEG